MRPILSLLLCLAALPAAAQERRASHCISLVDAAPGLTVIPASFAEPVPQHSVRLHYIDHSMVLVMAEDGTAAVTDYNGYLGPTAFTPDAVTMNNAHSTHWTALPDPDIPHVLEGWGTADNPRDHWLDLGTMVIRNVHTDTRSGSFGAEPRVNGNSIFVFEAAGLCIGHMGHLHHVPDSSQVAAIGRLDVVMVPVDGGLTLTRSELIETVTRFRSSIVIPIHAFGAGTLGRFLDDMAGDFDIETVDGPSIEVSLRSLPDRPTITVLRPRFLSDE